MVDSVSKLISDLGLAETSSRALCLWARWRLSEEYKKMRQRLHRKAMTTRALIRLILWVLDGVHLQYSMGVGGF